MMNLLLLLATAIICALPPHITLAPDYARKYRFRILSSRPPDLPTDSNLLLSAKRIAIICATPPHITLTPNYARKWRFRILSSRPLDSRDSKLLVLLATPIICAPSANISCLSTAYYSPANALPYTEERQTADKLVYGKTICQIAK